MKKLLDMTGLVPVTTVRSAIRRRIGTEPLTRTPVAVRGSDRPD
jgi:hypothetical protein